MEHYDLADRLDDLICADEGGSKYHHGYRSSEVVGALFGWALLGVGIYAAVRYLTLNLTFEPPPKAQGHTAAAPRPDQLPTFSKDPATPTVVVPATRDPEPEEQQQHPHLIKQQEPLKGPEVGSAVSSVAVVGVYQVDKDDDKVDGLGGQKNPSNGHEVEEDEVLPPISLGTDKEAVHWVNRCFFILYSDPFVYRRIVEKWLETLTTHTIGLEEHVHVEFHPKVETAKAAPRVTNMTTSSHPGDNLTITGDIEVSGVTVLGRLYWTGDGSKGSSSPRGSHPIRFHVDHLKGRLNISVLARERHVIAKLDGWPEVKTRMEPCQGSGRAGSTEVLRKLCSKGNDQVVTGLRVSQLTMNLFNDFEDPNDRIFFEDNKPIFPTFIRKTLTRDDNNGSCIDKVTSRLSVKVVQASHLGSFQNIDGFGEVRKPFVTIEVDEPSQRRRTSAVTPVNTKSSTNHQNNQEGSIWNQSFNFDLTSKSREVLFEVWDSSNAGNQQDQMRFLGLGLVSLHELSVGKGPQKHVVPLQGRPYLETQEDEVDISGLLTVLFEVNPPGDRFDSSPAPASEKAGPTGKKLPAKGKKRTLVSTQNKRVVPSSNLKRSVSFEGVGARLSFSDFDDEDEDDEDEDDEAGYENGCNGHENGNGLSAMGSSSMHTLPRDLGAVTPRMTLRKRLMNSLRSLSADRARSLVDRRRSGGPSAGLLLVPKDTSSSLSDVSGISSASAKTYVTEESSLVLERVEAGGITKFYTVPFEVAKTTKLKKLKGTRLHVFMDHIFVAKWIKGGTTCFACEMPIPFKLGKHAYVCRDCSIVVHKPCHIKVDKICKETSLPSMDLLHFMEMES